VKAHPSLALLATVMALSACKKTENEGTKEKDVATSSATSVFVDVPVLTMSDNPDCPLWGAVQLTTDVPTTVEVHGTVAGDPWSKSFDALQTEHDLTLLGLRADADLELMVTVEDEGGKQTTWEGLLEDKTDPLPASFPDFETMVARPDLMEPGYTLFSVTFPDVTHPQYGIVVDEMGRVVWFITDPLGVGLFGQLEDGSLYYGSDRYGASVVDGRGTILQAWHTSIADTHAPSSILLESEFVHHDMIQLPNGNMLTFGMEILVHPNYPSSEGNPNAPGTTADVASDIVVEFASDGSVVQQWPFADLIDTSRIGYDSVTGPWWTNFLGQALKDWTHSNALYYNEAEDTILASIRHQDAVINFSRATGELIWILAPSENWSPEFLPYVLAPAGPDFRHAYHQHGAKMTPDGTILMFDNGNNQASAFEPRTEGPDIRSRAVEYAVDPVAMTQTQVWEWDDLPGAGYAIAQGDADILPATNNALITYGHMPEFTPNAPSAQVVEVTRGATEEIVFHMAFETGAWVYRSDRVDSIYPPQ